MHLKKSEYISFSYHFFLFDSVSPVFITDTVDVPKPTRALTFSTVFDNLKNLLLKPPVTISVTERT